MIDDAPELKDNPWARWGIYRSNDVKARPIALFITKKDCWDWLDYKKEQCFFKTGSMEEAEQNWSSQGYSVDRFVVETRGYTLKNFETRFSAWSNA